MTPLLHRFACAGALCGALGAHALAQPAPSRTSPAAPPAAPASDGPGAVRLNPPPSPSEMLRLEHSYRIAADWRWRHGRSVSDLSTFFSIVGTGATLASAVTGALGGDDPHTGSFVEMQHKQTLLGASRGLLYGGAVSSGTSFLLATLGLRDQHEALGLRGADPGRGLLTAGATLGALSISGSVFAAAMGDEQFVPGMGDEVRKNVVLGITIGAAVCSALNGLLYYLDGRQLRRAHARLSD